MSYSKKVTIAMSENLVYVLVEGDHCSEEEALRTAAGIILSELHARYGYESARAAAVRYLVVGGEEE